MLKTLQCLSITYTIKFKSDHGYTPWSLNPLELLFHLFTALQILWLHCYSSNTPRTVPLWCFLPSITVTLLQMVFISHLEYFLKIFHCFSTYSFISAKYFLYTATRVAFLQYVFDHVTSLSENYFRINSKVINNGQTGSL